jgi:hypothetical protein
MALVGACLITLSIASSSRVREVASHAMGTLRARVMLRHISLLDVHDPVSNRVFFADLLSLNDPCADEEFVVRCTFATPTG